MSLKSRCFYASYRVLHPYLYRHFMASKKIPFTAWIGKLKYLLGVSIIEVPAEVVKKAGGPGKQRFICTVNNTESFPCGLMAYGTGMAYITINKARMKKLGLKEGDMVKVMLVKDESEFGMPMCEELKELLEQDPEGDARFRMLTPGKQRTIIYYISNVKSSQLRIDRALLLIGNLKKMPKDKVHMRGLLGLDE